MYTVSGSIANEVYLKLALSLRDTDERLSRHYMAGTSSVKERIHSGFTLTNPHNKWVSLRPINPAFALAEVFWILAGDNRVEWIAFWNRRMEDFAENKPYSHGAYGARLGCANVKGMAPLTEGIFSVQDQLFEAYLALKADPNSRQVVMNIYDYRYDMPTSIGPVAGDIPCNVTAIPYIADGKLHWLQTMRSNDLIWGTPYNLVQWCSLQEVLAGWLGVDVGQYSHIVSSLHVYENHYSELERVCGYNLLNLPAVSYTTDMGLSGYSYEEWQSIFIEAYYLINDMMAATIDRDMDGLESIERKLEILMYESHEYSDILYVLLAECYRKLGKADNYNSAIGSTSAGYNMLWNDWCDYTLELSINR